MSKDKEQKQNNAPKFSLEGSRYDQASYSGRFLGFLDVVDPRCLIVSDAEVDEALKKLDTFKKFNANVKNPAERKLPPGLDDASLWEAKKIRDAVVHPVTGEKIFPLFRMAAFVPTNVPLVAGMLNHNSIFGTIFWQWANQSYNSAINYANRSGGESDVSEIAQSYGVAVAVSCGLALGVRWLGSNGPKTIQTIAKIPFVVPFVGVTSAGSANVYLSRRKEIENGVKVVDENGKEVGTSRIAAKEGVIKTILSRSIGLPIPVLILPHFVMKAVPKTSGPRVMMLAELLAIVGSLTIGLPAAIALFPQKLEFDATKLEPEFHNLKNPDGTPLIKLYSNKGL